MTHIQKRLDERGIILPTPAPAVGNYVPALLEGNLLFISGQLPFDTDGNLAVRGIIGENLNVDDGVRAAEYCCINILAQAAHILNGDLSHIKRCLKLGGFVASAPNYSDHPKIINGASDLLVDILGEPGKHTRIAVGVSSLPLGAAVEIDAQFIIEMK